MEFTDHVILYAKGWYGKSNNGIISDLSVLLSKYSNIEGEYISKRDIMEFIISAFVKTTQSTPINISDALKEILIPLFPVDSKYFRSPESILIGKISVWTPDDSWEFSYQDLKEGKNLLPHSFKDNS